MSKTYKFLFTTLLAACLIPAHAAFDKITFGGAINCNNPSRTGTLKFIPGAPNGTYSALIQADTTSEDLYVDDEPLSPDGYTKSFKIPKDESTGLKFTARYSLEALQAMGSFEEFTVPFTINPGDETTSLTGFGSASGTLTINDTGCSETDSDDTDDEGDDLGDLVDEATIDGFVEINTNELISTEQDLKVNVTYKVPTGLYQTFVGELKEGEDITEKAKEFAKEFGFKLDFKKLKKAAAKELKEAAKGLKGDSRKEAIEAAKKQGFNKLLSEIRLKLPKLKDAKDKEATKKIRIAKKKKILEALEAEVKSITEDEGTGKTCLSFILTLPAKVCAKDADTKTLILAGQEIDLLGLEAGETFTIDLPVKIVGEFQEFFGTSNGKGGNNGKTDITLTLTNPATE